MSECYRKASGFKADNLIFTVISAASNARSETRWVSCVQTFHAQINKPRGPVRPTLARHQAAGAPPQTHRHRVSRACCARRRPHIRRAWCSSFTSWHGVTRFSHFMKTRGSLHHGDVRRQTLCYRLLSAFHQIRDEIRELPRKFLSKATECTVFPLIHSGFPSQWFFSGKIFHTVKDFGTFFHIHPLANVNTPGGIGV